MERFNPIPTFTEYLQQANDTLVTMVQIETKEALDAVDEIAAVDGVDVLFIGPFDLGALCYESPLTSNADLLQGNNIGHPIIEGQVAQELKDAIAKVLAACHKAGKKCGIFSVGGPQAKLFAEQGFDLISVATDYTALDFTLKEQLATAKGGVKPEAGKSY
jgi:4-hydroxy-2-oxoheptanedioate aldolase